MSELPNCWRPDPHFSSKIERFLLRQAQEVKRADSERGKALFALVRSLPPLPVRHQ